VEGCRGPWDGRAGGGQEVGDVQSLPNPELREPITMAAQSNPAWDAGVAIWMNEFRARRAAPTQGPSASSPLSSHCV
jgi:hypothetical protein